MRRIKVALIAAAALWCLAALARADGFGQFIGDVTATWLADGREMKLTENFTYVDPTGKRWDAPKGSVVDGASIPQILWSAIGGPFEGTYRNASVVHDVACVRQDQPWQRVHRMFYYAMRCGGVGERRALAMYYAVYNYGPHWREPESFLDKVGGTFKGIAGIFAPHSAAPPPPPPPPPPTPLPGDLLDRIERQIQDQQLSTPEQIEKLPKY